MNRIVPTQEQIDAAEKAGAVWADSIDWAGIQCRTLIHWNSLTSHLPGFGNYTEERKASTPIHQTCALRFRDGTLIFEPANCS